MPTIFYQLMKMIGVIRPTDFFSDDETELGAVFGKHIKRRGGVELDRILTFRVAVWCVINKH